MHSAAFVAQKWSFEVDAQRASLRPIASAAGGPFRKLNRIGELAEEFLAETAPENNEKNDKKLTV